ncbi:EGF family domain-containing protein [Toxoplasma gondii p89]|uniref:EGF family domain-containing protein n=1 Tax=Toxoplasma gondii p89 TaxID=943119 RepID=A0A086L1N7_TOXGO|nr:EGF family domain-containing protein [Toxoplasma gondii p89]
MRVPGARSLWRQFLLAGGCVATCIVHDASAIHERGLHFLAQSGSTHQLTDNTAPPSLFALSNYARGRQIDDVGQAAGGSGVTDVDPESSAKPQHAYIGAGSCESNPCGEDADCTENSLGHACTCHLGFFWDGQLCISIREHHMCAPGQPVDLNVRNEYECECIPGYVVGTGTAPNGAAVETCVVETCPDGYYRDGDSCKLPTNDLCEPGRLGPQTNPNEYTCKCPATHFVETFVGDGNVNLQRCTPDPCYGQCSSGTCTRSTSEESGFTCECPEHYSVVTVGDKQVCQAGPCAENPCGDPEIGHTCRATSDTEYTCSCAPGYVFNGVTCAESSANPCYPGTVATTDGLGGYTCNCTAGYMAEDIEDSGDVTQQRCIEDVCYNKCDNGTCSRTPRLGSDSAYRCECHEGYDVKRNDQGEYCEAIGCSSNPCGPPEEGHQCSVSGDNGYACTCASKYFFNGTECEKATNALCSPGRLGTQANTNEYTCKCPATHFVETFVGDGNVNLQRCTPDPCYGQCSSGTCTRSTSEESGFTCECPEHYSVVTVGDKQVCKAVSCAQNPCGNPEMHTCTRFGDTDYMCFCAAGYYFDGFTCKVLTGDLCWPGELGTQETRNSYTCSCPDGYNRDKYLSDGGVTLERCLEDVCYNKCDNGNCIEVNGETRTYRCQCNEGYSPDQSGKNCVRDQCSTSPCGPSSLGHQCTNEEDGTYSCICANGYYLNGNTCEMAINLRCYPGVLGTQLRPNEYTCNCTPPYIAQDFEAAGGVTLQKCVRDPCSGQCAHGTCTQSSETSWGYTCNCDTHYTLEETEHGQYCRGDPCASSPCGNEDDGHQCTSPDESTYSCQCSQGFYFDGGKCQRVSEDLCEHGSLGTLTANQYTCNCDEGYVTQDFDVAENVTLQRCIADVCYRQCDHGECRVDDSRDGGYACTCSEGYSVASTPEGEFCQEDPCSLNPCGWPDRADSCENTAESSYACTCAAGYYYDGQTCQEATDDLCTPGWLGEQTHVNAYTCTCPSGTVVEDFEGAGQVALQKCVADTCLHDRCSPGSCTPNHSAPFGYECTCGPGLSLEMTQDGPMCAHDPCSLSPCGSPEANHICVNLVGEEYACTCASGYYLNGNSCAPLSDSLCAPGNVQQDDVNTYTCVCPDSHQLQEFTGPAGLPVQRCVADICGDQCDPGSCSHDKTKNGWYTCTCPPGFLSQPGAPVTGGEKCVPDECPLEDCGLENVKYCLRVNGAPQCFCNDGYYYNKFTAQCTLENPCDYDVCGASEAVENCNFLGGGKWTCECRPGFRVETSARDEQSCVRASFCDGDPCGPPDVNRCVSTLKGYSCRCGAGYTLVRKPQMTCEPVS